jgi:hypothetical protein
VISFASTPPAYVNTTAVTLTVDASDAGAGVASVWAKIGTTRIPASPSGTHWTVTVPVADGSNTISVWAVDAASPPNSGEGVAQIVTVMRDQSAPNGNVLLNPASYFDERTMYLASAAVPPVYAFPNGTTKVAVATVGSVYKASTRLFWASQPTAAQLEGANPDNIPYVQIAVTTTGGSPITGATYSIRVAGGAPLTGDLMPWSTSGSSSLVFDVPLSANIIPDLASTTTTAAIPLSVSAVFTDAAGNIGSTPPLTVSFNVIAPPLYVYEDTSFSSVVDFKSTYNWHLSDGSYATLFDPNTTVFGATNTVRLARFLVANPYPSPVAIDAPSYSWELDEVWYAATTAVARELLIPPGTVPSMWAGCFPAGEVIVNPRCFQTSGAPYYEPVDASVPCTANPPATWSNRTTSLTSAPSTEAYLFYLGADYGPAPTTAGGRVVVPAATGATASAGVSALYLVRPRNSQTLAGARTIALSGAPPWRVEDGGKYFGGSYTERCTNGHDATAGLVAYLYLPVTNYDHWLGAAADSLTGSFAPTTYALTGALVEKGSPTTASASLTITRTIAH